MIQTNDIQILVSGSALLLTKLESQNANRSQLWSGLVGRRVGEGCAIGVGEVHPEALVYFDKEGSK